MPSRADTHEVLTTLQHSKPGLNLDHKDLCFLVALSIHIEQQGKVSLSEELLRDEFERVWELVEPGACATSAC